MKILIFTFLILTESQLFGQDRSNYKYYSAITDNFPNKIIPSDTVRTSFIDSIKNSLIDKKQVKNNLVYYEDYAGSWWAAFNVNKSIWTKIPLPFDLTDSVSLINIDKKGAPELIIKGYYRQYGTGGGDAEGGLLIFNIDNSPTLILNILNYCLSEGFGERQDEDHLGEGAYRNEYQRKVSLNTGGITIHQNTKTNFDFDVCKISKVPSGQYKLINGKFLIQK